MSLDLNIAICDDEKYYRDYIEKIVINYLEKEGVFPEIDTFVSGEAFCEEEENVHRFDIIFLDIEMDGMNGMQTAYHIREKNPDVEIVFITITPDYVFEGYNVRAVRYIMKNEIDKCLPDCLGSILKDKKYIGQRMEFLFVGGKRTVLLDDLFYVESHSHKLQFKTKDDTLSMYGRINELEIKLSDYNFVRCHQSFLVNIIHIEKIKNYVIYLSDGSEIPVSRPRYAEVKEKYLQYKEV